MSLRETALGIGLALAGCGGKTEAPIQQDTVSGEDVYNAECSPEAVESAKLDAQFRQNLFGVLEMEKKFEHTDSEEACFLRVSRLCWEAGDSARRAMTNTAGSQRVLNAGELANADDIGDRRRKDCMRASGFPPHGLEVRF